MYVLLAFVMLLRGFVDAMMMRTQLALAAGGAQGYLPPEHYNQIFSAHGTIMIFFVAMTFMIGLMNFVVPLQLGIRDVAFPVLNSVSFWLTAAGVLLVNLSLVRRRVRPHRLAGLSAAVGARLLAGRRRRLLPVGAADLRASARCCPGINLTTTILKMRAPGMGYVADADLLLDGAGVEPADRRGLPDPDRDLRDAAARPLSRLPLLHERRSAATR